MRTNIPLLFSVWNAMRLLWRHPSMAFYLAHHAWKWHKPEVALLAFWLAVETAFAAMLTWRIRLARRIRRAGRIAQ